MNRQDLLAADPRGVEMLFQYGVSQKQMAKAYNVPIGSITKILDKLKVNTKVELLVGERFDPRKPEPEAAPVETEEPEATELVPAPPREIITDPVKIAELMSEPELPAMPEPVPPQIYYGFKWFYGATKSNVPVMTVLSDGRISLPTAIRAQYSGTHMRIGIAPDAQCVVIGETDIAGRGIKPSIKQGKIRSNGIHSEVTRNGIALPARYQMAWNEPEQVWAGTLIP